MKKFLFTLICLASTSTFANSDRKFPAEYYQPHEKRTRFSRLQESKKVVLKSIPSGSILRLARDLEIPEGKNSISFSENNLSCALSIGNEGQRQYRKGDELQVVEAVQYESFYSFSYSSEYLYLDKDITKIWLNGEQTSSITCVKNSKNRRLNSHNTVVTEGYISKDEIELALMGSIGFY